MTSSCIWRCCRSTPRHSKSEAPLNGAKLVVYPDGLLDLGKLERTIAQSGVSVLWLAAALFHQVVDEQLSAIAGVRQLLAATFSKHGMSPLGRGASARRHFAKTYRSL